MRYAKTPLNPEEQVQLLIERGLDCGYIERTHHYLSHIGYYRLSAYWLPFELPSDDHQTRNHAFIPGTTFDSVLNLYIFDRKLRLLVMDAIERIEVSIRTRWSGAMALCYGSHAYMQTVLFKDSKAHSKDLDKLTGELEKSSETFIVHYRNKYDEPRLPPIWVVVETMSLGTLARWLRNTKNTDVKKEVMQGLNMPTIEVLENTLNALTPIRNICAHHSRLWNRRLVMKMPVIKRLRDQMVPQDAANFQAHYLFNYLVTIEHLMHIINPHGTWKKRLLELLATVSEGELRSMGFPADWQQRLPWREVQP